MADRTTAKQKVATTDVIDLRCLSDTFADFNRTGGLLSYVKGTSGDVFSTSGDVFISLTGCNAKTGRLYNSSVPVNRQCTAAVQVVGAATSGEVSLLRSTGEEDEDAKTLFITPFRNQAGSDVVAICEAIKKKQKKQGSATEHREGEEEKMDEYELMLHIGKRSEGKIACQASLLLTTLRTHPDNVAATVEMSRNHKRITKRIAVSVAPKQDAGGGRGKHGDAYGTFIVDVDPLAGVLSPVTFHSLLRATHFASSDGDVYAGVMPAAAGETNEDEESIAVFTPAFAVRTPISAIIGPNAKFVCAKSITDLKLFSAEDEEEGKTAVAEEKVVDGEVAVDMLVVVEAEKEHPRQVAAIQHEAIITRLKAASGGIKCVRVSDKGSFPLFTAPSSTANDQHQPPVVSVLNNAWGTFVMHSRSPNVLCIDHSRKAAGGCNYCFASHYVLPSSHDTDRVGVPGGRGGRRGKGRGRGGGAANIAADSNPNIVNRPLILTMNTETYTPAVLFAENGKDLKYAVFSESDCHRSKGALDTLDEACRTLNQINSSEGAGAGGVSVEAKQQALVVCRRQLSITGGMADTIAKIRAANVLPTIVQIAQKDPDPKQQFEALWCLTNIGSGSTNDTDYLVKNNVHDVFVERLIKSEDSDVIEQAAWGIGNIAGEGAAYRDLFLKTEEVPLRLASLVGDKEQRSISLRRNCMWSLSNLCRSKPLPAIEMLRGVLPVISQVLEEQDVELLADALWAISYVSDGANDRIETVLSSGCMGAVFELLKGNPLPKPVPFSPENPLERCHDYQQQMKFGVTQGLISDIMHFLPHTDTKRLAFGCKDWFFDILCDDIELYNKATRPNTQNPALIIPALRTCGNIVSGSDAQTQLLVDLGLVEFLVPLLGMQNQKDSIKKEAAWSLSNIAAGNHDQVKRVAGNKEQCETLVEGYFHNSAEVRHETLWAFSNAFQGGRPEDLQFLIEAGVVAVFCDTMCRPPYKRGYQVASEGLESALLLAATTLSHDELQTAFDRSLPSVLSGEFGITLDVVKKQAECGEHKDVFLYMVTHGIPHMLRSGCDFEGDEMHTIMDNYFDWLNIDAGAKKEGGKV